VIVIGEIDWLIAFVIVIGEIDWLIAFVIVTGEIDWLIEMGKGKPDLCLVAELRRPWDACVHGSEKYYIY
jgi:hypothetical protein